jgi:hypothetical protein
MVTTGLPEIEIPKPTLLLKEDFVNETEFPVTVKSIPLPLEVVEPFPEEMTLVNAAPFAAVATIPLP